MELLNEVKNEMEKGRYDFSDKKWTGKRLGLLLDIVNATERVMKRKEDLVDGTGFIEQWLSAELTNLKNK